MYRKCLFRELRDGLYLGQRYQRNHDDRPMDCLNHPLRRLPVVSPEDLYHERFLIPRLYE